MSAEFAPVRVLHILGPLRPSGMERMLASSSDYFRGENITNIILGQGDEHPFADELRACGYDVREMSSVADSLGNAWALRKLVRELEVDVIHIHTEGNYLRTTFACKVALGSRGGLIRTVHSVFEAKGTWRIKRLLQALAADRMLSSLVVPSPDVDINERKLGRRARVIYNWVDDRFFAMRAAHDFRARVKGESPLALIVGNCSDIKHHELALRALVSSTHSVIHLGDELGASSEELALLKELEIDGRLVDRGVHPPDEALGRADYFMIPSRHEGMSVALAEALVAGLPALVNDVPGLRWARCMNGVSVLPEIESAWASGLPGWRSETINAGPLAIDFSAMRGAREYAELYRAAARRAS
jgi:glycosyltransferase involved in cell wall biosynthesis